MLISEKSVEIEFINRFKIQGVNVQCKMEFLPGKLTLLTGENGIGKSSLIQFLKLNQKEFLNDMNTVFLDQFPLKPINDINFLTLSNQLMNERREILPICSKLQEACSAFFKNPINSLSGGQNQLIKVLLACYISGDFFIFDEPFQYLDTKNTDLLRNIFKELKLLNKKILVIEHRKEIIHDLIDSAYKMENSMNQIEVSRDGI